MRVGPIGWRMVVIGWGHVMGSGMQAMLEMRKGRVVLSVFFTLLLVNCEARIWQMHALRGYSRYSAKQFFLLAKLDLSRPHRRYMTNHGPVEPVLSQGRRR